MEFLKREDDNRQTIINRYDEYMNQTKPVLDFYSSRKKFHEIDGSLKIDEITNLRPGGMRGAIEYGQPLAGSAVLEEWRRYKVIK